MDLPFKPSTFFWGLTAIYVVAGIAALAYLGFTEGVDAAVGSIKVVLVVWMELAGAALVCRIWEEGKRR